MKLHWAQKWVSILYGSVQILLQGQLPESETCSLVQLVHIASDADTPAKSPLQPAVQTILDEFSAVFAEPSGLLSRRCCDHTIPLIPGAQPLSVRPYRYAPALKTEIETQVSEMLQSGLIHPSLSAFSSPVLLVRKKDGSWQFCIDYRMLNALTIKSKFPIPVIDELLDALSNASWFSVLDLQVGFNQTRLAPGEEHKTAFQTHWGHFEFSVMSFWLTGALDTFQGAMNTTLYPLLGKCVIVFFDDILVFSSSFDEHLSHLRQVLELLARVQWQVKLSKCRFAQQSIAYLGHVISAAGVAIDPEKVQSIRDWLVPQDVKQLRSFLGLVGYYRKFVRHFTFLARRMTDVLKKGTLFIWTPAHETAFTTLQQALMSAPVLALLDFSKPF